MARVALVFLGFVVSFATIVAFSAANDVEYRAQSAFRDSASALETNWRQRVPRSYGAANPDAETQSGIDRLRAGGATRREVERYLITAHDVQAMLGVIAADPNVSKGIISTTSTFAPKLREDPNITRLMPYRLELKPRDVLCRGLRSFRSAVRRLGHDRHENPWLREIGPTGADASGLSSQPRASASPSWASRRFWGSSG